MRVLLIHNYYQQFGGRGYGRRTRDRSLLEERGVEVQVCSRHNDEITGVRPLAQSALSAEGYLGRKIPSPN